METVHYGRQVGNSASMKSGDTSFERSNERHSEGVAQDGRNVTSSFVTNLPILTVWNRGIAHGDSPSSTNNFVPREPYQIHPLEFRTGVMRSGRMEATRVSAIQTTMTPSALYILFAYGRSAWYRIRRPANNCVKRSQSTNTYSNRYFLHPSSPRFLIIRGSDRRV